MVAADRVPQGVSGLDVQTGRRLVEQDQVGAADEGDGHREPALLPSGQAAGLAPFETGKGELLQQLSGRHGVGEVAGDEVDHLMNPQRRGQTGLLRGATESTAAGGVAWVAAEELDGPRRRPTQPVEQLQKRGLAGAVRTEHAQQLPGRDVQRDAVKGGDLAIAPGCRNGPSEDFHFSLLAVRSGTQAGRAGRRCSP